MAAGAREVAQQRALLGEVVGEALHALLANDPAPPNAPLFRNANRTPLRRHTVTKAVKRIASLCVHLGAVESATSTHSFRVGCAIMLKFTGNFTKLQIMEWCRWHSMKSIDIYCQGGPVLSPAFASLAAMITTGNPTSVNHTFDFDTLRSELDGPAYAGLPTTSIYSRR